MLINLHKLSESLEAKYLQESQLNEKFGDMPDWLSKRILTGKYNRYDGQGQRNYGIHKTDQYGNPDMGAKNPEFGNRPSYINARDSSGDQSLFGQMLAHGINLDSVKVIECDKPEKRTDDKLKAPNIPIFLLSNNQVYVKGINDNEIYRGDNPTYAGLAFKNVSMKVILDEVVKFAYIDGTDDDNFRVNEVRGARDKMKQDMKGIPERKREKAGTQGWENYDKSGYKQIPSAKRYKNKLVELKCSKIYDVLDEKYQFLEEIKQELANIMFSTDIKSMGDDEDYATAFTAYENIYEKFQKAVSYYVDVLATVDRIVNDDNKDEASKKEELIYFINNDADYSSLMYYTKELEKMAPSVFNSVIDWI